MDAWVRSLFGGVLLVALAIAALVAFNVYGQDMRPLLQQYTGMSEPALFVTLLLVFLVGFSLAHRPTGEAAELDAISRKGLLAKPHARIKPTIDYTEVEEIEFVQEAYIAYLQDRTRKIEATRPILLKVNLSPPMAGIIPFFSRGAPLQRDILLYFLEKLLKQFENFKYVVFVNHLGRFVFFAKAKDLRDEIEPIDGSQIIDLLNGYVIDELQKLPLFNKCSVTTRDSNVRVLHRMARDGVTEAMVVSHSWGKRHFGVVELSKLLAKVLLLPKKDKDLYSPLRAFRSEEKDAVEEDGFLASDEPAETER